MPTSLDTALPRVGEGSVATSLNTAQCIGRPVGAYFSFGDPLPPARGIDTVIVNGKPVWREHRPTGARPGRVLQRSA